MRWGLLNLLGKMTNTAQPAFSTYLSGNLTDVTGDGTDYYPVFDTELFDQSANFDISTGIFTAPVTGRYMFVLNLHMTGLTANMNDNRIAIVTTARTYRNNFNVGAGANPFTQYAHKIVALCDMAVGETAKPYVSYGGGTKVADIVGTNTLNSYFAGYLVC